MKGPRRIQKSVVYALVTALVAWSAAIATPALAQQDHDSHADVVDNAAMRTLAAQPVSHTNEALAAAAVRTPLSVRLLSFNDFHGYISAGQAVAGRQVGGAAVFAAYLRQAQSGYDGRSFIVNAGDSVGASPLSSALSKDEPTIQFLNQLGNSSCGYAQRMNPKCNLVGTLGNHEFDQGRIEMLRLLTGYGGNAATGPFLQNPWRGTTFPTINSNVVATNTGRPILPPYVIKYVTYTDAATGVSSEIPIAFIGSVLRDTPQIVTPSGIVGLTFQDEAASINRYVAEVKAMGVRAIVVLIHQGGFQTSYTGQTDPVRPTVSGDILPIITALDDEVDLVVSGHSHAFTNAIVNNRNGKPILVTQSFSFSTAYGTIDLAIDPDSKDIVTKSASIVTTYAFNPKVVGGTTVDDTASPAVTPDAAAASLVAQAEALSSPIANQVIAALPAGVDVTRTQNVTTPASPCPTPPTPLVNNPIGCYATGTIGESQLGDLIADAQRAAAGTDFAFMNAGGIRNDLLYARVHPAGIPLGSVTYNDLFNIQPFGNSLVKMNLTGQQIFDVLNQQFPPAQSGTTFRFMQISGFTYTWDGNGLPGNRVTSVKKGGVEISKGATYSIVCNSFMATGGDGYTVFNLGTSRIGVGQDIDALINYLNAIKNPTTGLFPIPAQNRITRLN